MLVLGRIRKCVIPAAGMGTRFYPLTRAQPKEMLPILDKPVIHYVVEEAVNSGHSVEVITISDLFMHSFIFLQILTDFKFFTIGS